jgi:hypothetical protein
MYRRSAALMIVVRVVIAIDPQMYREVLAFHIHKKRPRSEVVLASPQALPAEVERVRPHLILANEVPSELKGMGFFFWVEVNTDDALVATISADGYSTTIHDVSLQDLLVVVDKAEKELAHRVEA